jgi:hypothetical protein
MDASLTSSEFEVLRHLLQRFAEHELDQFEQWRFDSSYGPVFVSLTRELPPGWPAEAFTPVLKPLLAETGRFARASDPAQVESREDLVRLIGQLRDDLAGTGTAEWENPNLERFLEALEAFLDGIDGYYANRGQQPPAGPDWALFATALVAASGYE